MPSHFSTIGFSIESEEDMMAIGNEALKTAVEVPAKKGSYLRWQDESGAELWLQANQAGELVGMNPHFSGKAAMTVGIRSRMDDVEHPLDGSFHAWSNPAEGSTEEGDYPFLFDCPDISAHPDIALPSRATAQVAAFAHEASVFESEDAFDESQKDQELKFSSQSFIPSGLFTSDGEENSAPQALGLITGSIVAAERKTNTLSKNVFYWALVETYGGQFDVVLDESLVERVPPVGGIVTGAFWLSGRLLEYQKRKSWLRRIIG